MPLPSGSRSIVIGEGSTPLACAESLIRSGFELLAICGQDERFAAWAEEHGVLHFDKISALARTPELVELDFLFSIANYRIIPKNLLTRARRCAINYHDGPLPRYAGTFATTWAMMNSEVMHGVTWHVMVEEVDAGDILRQVEVPIAPEEPVSSLNRKCFMAAIRSFNRLVDDIDTALANRTPQDLSERTYFEFYRRPPNACLIDFQRPASEISAFVRSLKLEPGENRIGTPKVLLETGWVIVDQVRMLNSGPTGTPGTVLQASADTMVISAADRDLELSGLTTLEGQAAELRSETVTALRHLGTEEQAQLTSAYDRAARSESLWVGLLHEAPVARLPYGAALGRMASIDIEVPSTLTSSLCDRAAIYLLRLHAQALSKLAHIDRQLVGLRSPETAMAARQSFGLLADTVPLPLADLRTGFSIPAKFDAKQSKLFTFARDLAKRYPKVNLKEALHTPITFDIAEDGTGPMWDCIAADGMHLAITIAKDGSRCRWQFPEQLSDTMRALSLRFLAHLDRVRPISA